MGNAKVAPELIENINYTREKCYNCYRPMSSCMCKYIKPIDTNTRFIIIMHPKEFKKTKNGTGRFTNQSLKNSKIYIGIDFNKNYEINNIINDDNNNCFVLYPHKYSIKLNHQSIQKEKKTIIYNYESIEKINNYHNSHTIVCII